jgi:hypothetical protein
MPIHWLASKPSTIVLTVGMSGKAGSRCPGHRHSAPERMKSMSKSTVPEKPSEATNAKPQAGRLGFHFLWRLDSLDFQFLLNAACRCVSVPALSWE